MRIAYLTQSYPPMISGASIAARQLAQGMASRGHQVLVIAASDKTHPYITLEPNLTVVRFSSVYNPWRVGQRFLLFSRAALMRTLSDFKPDLIHTHDPLQLGLAGAAYARRAGIPVLLSIHQLPWFAASYLPDIGQLRTLAESILWRYASYLLAKFDVAFTPTQTIADIINKRTGIQPYVISYGLDLTVFTPSPLSADIELGLRKFFDLPPGIPVVLHVGRLDVDKDVDVVIQAVAQTLSKSDAYLLVVGDGVQKSALMALSKSLGILERVRFAGYVTLADGLANLYRLADIFVTASEIETQGIVLLEAAASGLPIATVRATCLHEIVHHGVNGYLTPRGDISQLAQSMSALLADPALARKMGHAGRMLVQEHSKERSTDRIEEMYQLQADNHRVTPRPAQGFKLLLLKRAKQWTRR